MTERHAEPCRCVGSARGAPGAAGGRDRRRRAGTGDPLGARDRDARSRRPAQGRRAGPDDRPGRGRRRQPPGGLDRVADRAGDGRSGRGAGLELARGPGAGGRRLRARRRAGRRLPPPGALHRDHRGRPRRGRQRAVRAARARRGDPPPLHRADPAGPRRARDPRRADRGRRQPGRARGRRRLARLLRQRARTATIWRSRPGPTCTAPRIAARAAEGMFAVEVRLLDSSWGRLLALAIENPLDDFDRVAVERAALAVAIGLLAQQHDEQLRARSRGAFLSDLADGRVEEGDARRRADALGLAGTAPRRRCCRSSPPGARRRSPAGAASASPATRASPTGSPGRGCPATCAPRSPRPAWPCCSARATSTC